MDSRMLLWALGIWFLFVVAAILNAGLRNSFVTPRLGEQAGHMISTVILVSFMLVITFLFVRALRTRYSSTSFLIVGVVWLILTVSFEFLFGHYVMGTSWGRLLADYNILAGRVWILVPATAFLAPWLLRLLLRT